MKRSHWPALGAGVLCLMGATASADVGFHPPIVIPAPDPSSRTLWLRGGDFDGDDDREERGRAPGSARDGDGGAPLTVDVYQKN